MGKRRRRKHDQDESTAHLEPHVFTDQAAAERPPRPTPTTRPGVTCGSTTPRGSVSWVVRIERRLASYYLHEDGSFIR